MKILSSVAVTVIILVIVTATIAQADCPSDVTRTTIFFVNGFDNTPKKAEDSRQLLEAKLKDFIFRQNPANPKLQIDCLTIKLSYNTNETRLEELFQAARQRMESSSFWLAYNHIANGSEEIILRDIFAQIYRDQVVQLSSTSYVIDADHAKHVEMYRAEIRAGNEVLAVAHSQGNFYANEAYSNLFNAANPLTTKSFGIVSIATPDHFVAGAIASNEQYVTLAEDLVIFNVRLVIPSTLPPNETNKLLNEDPDGHAFRGAYISPAEPNKDPVFDGSRPSELDIMLNIIGVISNRLEPPRNTPIILASGLYYPNFIDVD